jgi:hypothetical protein
MIGNSVVAVSKYSRNKLRFFVKFSSFAFLFAVACICSKNGISSYFYPRTFILVLSSHFYGGLLRRIHTHHTHCHISMIALLAQVSPTLFKRIQADFEVLDAIFFDGTSDDTTFSPDTDLLAVNYGASLEPLFKRIASESGMKAEDYDDCLKVQSHPWYKAFSAAHELKGYELSYGTTYHKPSEVLTLAHHLARMERDAESSAEASAEAISEDIYHDDDNSNDDALAMLSAYFQRAAERGCVVISGIED